MPESARIGREFVASVALLTMPLIQGRNSGNIMTDEQQSKPFTPEEKQSAQVVKKDAFSRVRLPKLAEQVPDAVKEAITTVWSDIEEDNLAKVYRWYLRGLPAQMAVCKVRTDLEIAENIKGKGSRS